MRVGKNQVMIDKTGIYHQFILSISILYDQSHSFVFFK